MTDDIVAQLRLRTDPSQMLMCYPPRPAPDMLCCEAANRIEQLENQISHIIEHNNPQIEKANSYFKMLEEELARCNKIIDDYEEEHSKLRAEIERLRAALNADATLGDQTWGRER
jgi:septal ring factor EnvC (AmiA/AmiB activator)